MTDEEFHERNVLNEIHARKPAPVPAKPAPRPAAAANGKKQMNALASAVIAAVGKEIHEHRQERERQAEKIEHERQLQAARIEAALARLDAVMARAEVGSKGKDSESRILMVTR